MTEEEKLSTGIKSLLEKHVETYQGRRGNSEGFVRDVLLRLEPKPQATTAEILKDWFLPALQLGFAVFVFFFHESSIQSSGGSSGSEHDLGSLLLSSTQSEWVKEDLSPNVSDLSLALGISTLDVSSREEL